jgi:integral membrane protein
MPLGPRPDDVPRIRLVLKLFRVSAIVTGVFLLMLVVMMVARYGFLVDIEYSTAYGFGLTPRELIEERGSTNVSLIILTTHGWLYVLYLALDFLLWRFTRWSFGRFVFIALGGIIPLLSFFFEFLVPRWVRAEIAQVETPTEVAA